MSTTSNTAKPWSVTYAKTNFIRLSRLIIEGGTCVLQEVLDNIHPPAALASTLAKTTVKAQLKRLPKPFYDKVYPATGTYGKSEDFDITLLCRLLRDACGLLPPATGWYNEPIDADTSLSADVVRIRRQRNTLAHSGVKAEIQDEDFDATWKNIEAILIRLAGSVSVNNATKWTRNIDEMLTAPLTADEEIYTKELNKGYLEDIKLKEQIQSIRETMREILDILKTKNRENEKGVGELRKKLVEEDSINTMEVEAAFDIVSRDIFVFPDLKEGAFDDDFVKERMFRLLAPQLYARILEALNIQPGNSFLNIGSGTGYLSALVGCLLGIKGVNHGIERIQELVDFADESIKKLEETRQLTYSRPRFIAGSCFRLDTTSRKYDRLYCGAACTQEQLNGFIVKLLAGGGVAVVPCDNKVTYTCV